MSAPQTEVEGMTEAENGGSKNGFSLWRLVPVVVLAIGLVAIFALDLDAYLSYEALCEYHTFLTDYVRENLVVAALIYTIGYIVVIAFSLPGGAIMSLTGGFLFGIVTGSILTIIGATIGATALFLAAKTAFADILREKAGTKVQRMRKGFQENAFSYLLVLRLIPIFPFWLVNLVPALLNVSLPVYVAATFIGIIPGTVVYVSVGNGLGALLDACEKPDLGIIFQAEILLPLVGLAILSLVPMLYKRWRGRSSGE